MKLSNLAKEYIKLIFLYEDFHVENVREWLELIGQSPVEYKAGYRR